MRVRRAVLRALPWLCVCVSLIAAQLWVDTPAAQLARYSFYWIVWVALPGVLVHRAFRGTTGDLPEDIGYGSAVGLALNLVAWAIAVGAGVGEWLYVWPIPVLVLFIVVPALHRHWWIAEPRPLPLRWSWSVAAVMMLTIVVLALVHWAPNPLPPTTHTLFGDIYYHWANAAELRRTVRPTSPQFAGEPLQYHFFSDAYRASAGLISGVPLSTIMLRLWVAPVALTTVLVIAALARKVSGVWWTGPLAAAIAVGQQVTSIWPRFPNYVAPTVAWFSPTLTFSIPLVVVALALLVDVVRGRRLGRCWLLLGLMLVVAAGSKPSSLPIIACGLLLAVPATGMSVRRVPTGAIAALALVGAVLVATAPVVAGGTGGAGIQLGAMFSFRTEYLRVAGLKLVPGTGGLLPPGFEAMPSADKLVLPALMLCFLLGQISRLVGFGLVLRRSARRDPAAWLLLGTAVSGLGALFLVSHVANGQAYFWFSAVPAASVLTAWLLAELRPVHLRRTLLLGGVVLGAVVGAALWRYGPGRGPGTWRDEWPAFLGLPVLGLLVVVVTGVVVWYLLRVGRVRIAGGGLAVIVAAAVGLGCDTTYRSVEGSAKAVVAGDLPSTGSPGRFWVTADEMRAADWLARHAADGDRVATNVHCEMVRTDRNCINRSFWVSALTEHPVVLEGWAYQRSTQARHGENGLPYYRVGSPDPVRQRINDAVFTAPTAAGLAQLRDRYGARWLYADRRAGPVSALLDQLAQPRLRVGSVVVYELSDHSVQLPRVSAHRAS